MDFLNFPFFSNPESALILAFIINWVFILFIYFKARSLRFNPKSIITQFDPPNDISPVLARFLITSGRQGGMAGEISLTGSQLITLIDLYENDLLSTLNCIDENTVHFEINPNYASLPMKKEEAIFIDILKSKVGMSGTISDLIEGPRGRNESGEGFKELSDVWFKFWHVDLFNVAVSKGLMKNTGHKFTALSIYSISTLFGPFICIPFFFIPIVGQIITPIILLPQTIIVVLSFFITELANLHIFMGHPFFVVFIPIAFLSWLTWFQLLGSSVKTISMPLTDAGIELVRAINGYKQFLKTTDLDRLSFSFKRDADIRNIHTTFAWLAIFSLAKDEHWNQWYELSKAKKISEYQAPSSNLASSSTAQTKIE